MFRRFVSLVAFAAAAGLLAAAPLESAAAQRSAPPQQGGFFNFLFGGGGPPRFFPPRTTPRQPARPRSADPQIAAKTPVAKDQTARKVLVVGDFMASVVAAGLDKTFAEDPTLRVVDRTNPNSGLARQDYYDWARQLPNILAADTPAIVVIAIGANDHQALTGAVAAPWGTPEWEAAYKERIAGLTTILTTYGVPYFWIGTVAMRSVPEPDMTHFNDLFKPAVGPPNGHFVDVWDGFADENGRLIISGPDVDGQIRPLRTSNGINFTQAGEAKLAFYVAREIRRATGIGTGTVNLVATLTPSSRVEVGPDGRRRVVGPVISLNDPAPGTATVLAGDRTVLNAPPLLAAPHDSFSAQAILFQGTGLPVVKGRADDFTWPAQTATGAAPPAAP
jgi:hypothetical protein